MCNKKLGTPYDRCYKAIKEGVKDCQSKLGDSKTWSWDLAQLGHGVCEKFKPVMFMCSGVDYLKGNIVDTIKRSKSLKRTVTFLEQANDKVE